MQTIICKWEGSDESVRFVVSSTGLNFSLYGTRELEAFLLGIGDAFEALGEPPTELTIELRKERLLLDDVTRTTVKNNKKRLPKKEED